MEFNKQGIYLGASSPCDGAGDETISETGIVQGHAFSILKLV